MGTNSNAISLGHDRWALLRDWVLNDNVTINIYEGPAPDKLTLRPVETVDTTIGRTDDVTVIDELPSGQLKVKDLAIAQEIRRLGNDILDHYNPNNTSDEGDKNNDIARRTATALGIELDVLHGLEKRQAAEKPQTPRGNNR